MMDEEAVATILSILFAMLGIYLIFGGKALGVFLIGLSILCFIVSFPSKK